MFNISNYLQKFVNLDNKNLSRLSTISETIKKRSTILIDPKNIKIVGDKVKIDCSPSVRNEISMRKNLIESDLKSLNIHLSIF